MFEGAGERFAGAAHPTNNERADLRACDAFPTEVSADVVTDASRCGVGTSPVFLPTMPQRYQRCGTVLYGQRYGL